MLQNSIPITSKKKDSVNLSNLIMEEEKTGDEAADVEVLRDSVDKMVAEMEELEQKVNDIEQFYLSLNELKLKCSKRSGVVKEIDDRLTFSVKKHQLEAAKREAARAKRMQELIRQFGTIFRQITAHKCSWPFMHPVDVEGLGLHDYYEIIHKPMDFSTIKNQMEAKDGTGYKNVRDICADVRLVFENAMLYNDKRNKVHIMAVTLKEKFEEKWKLLLPKVKEEEKRQREEEAESRLGMQLTQEPANAKMARDINNELCKLDVDLDELREMAVQKCRQMSVEEKRKLGKSLGRLSNENLNKAMQIIARKNPSFDALADEVVIDMDEQSESTLWRLKFFVKDALEAQSKNPSLEDAVEAQSKNPSPEVGTVKKGSVANKRKRQICGALARAKRKRSKKVTP